MGSTMHLKFYFKPAEGIASMAVLNAGSAADRVRCLQAAALVPQDHRRAPALTLACPCLAQNEAMFYGSRFVKANETMAEVLPQLAEFLKEANLTGAAPAGTQGSSPTSAAATAPRPARAALAAAALVPAVLRLLL